LTETGPLDWLKAKLRPGARLGYDPWLHTPCQVERLAKAAQAAGAELEASRKHARETTDMLRDKMQEVEWLRVHKGVDDREGAVKAKGLVGQRRRGLGKILRSA